MPAAFVKHVGSATDKTGTTLKATVPTGGVAAGNRLVARIAHRTVASVPSITDSRGNTWAMDRDRGTNTAVAGHILSAHVDTALLAGDTITVGWNTLPTTGALTVDEFSGVAATGAVDAAAVMQGSSAAPSASVTQANTDDVIVGMVAVNGPSGDTFTQDTEFADLTRVGTTGGSATSNNSLAGGYWLVSALGTRTYNPLLGTSREWEDLVLAYKAAPTGGDTTPPTTTLGSQTRTTISRVPGWDAFDVTITANEPFVEYELRRVPASTSTRTEGSQIETATVVSTTSLVVTVTDDELVAALAAEGANTVKAFTKDAAGNWSL